VHIEGEIVIKRPVDEVFDFVADERNEPRYNPRMVSADLISPGPIGLGTLFRAKSKGMARTVEMVIEWTAYDRPRWLASSTRMSGVEIQGALTFDPVAEGTRMRWSWELVPRGFVPILQLVFKLMPSVVARMGRRQEQTIWGNLKALLEQTNGVPDAP
jgi:hypothetical protein